jgi:hypothetical protein
MADGVARGVRGLVSPSLFWEQVCSLEHCAARRRARQTGRRVPRTVDGGGVERDLLSGRGEVWVIGSHVMLMRILFR